MILPRMTDRIIPVVEPEVAEENDEEVAREDADQLISDLRSAWEEGLGPFMKNKPQERLTHYLKFTIPSEAELFMHPKYVDFATKGMNIWTGEVADEDTPAFLIRFWPTPQSRPMLNPQTGMPYESNMWRLLWGLPKDIVRLCLADFREVYGTHLDRVMQRQEEHAEEYGVI